jgi:hypothetical protein
MINRAAIVVRAKEPTVAWINSVDPVFNITLEEVNVEATVFLISPEDADEFDYWLEKEYLQIFKMELSGWYQNEDVWPEDLSFELFNDWFSVELHTVIEDLDGSSIEEEDEEEYEYDYYDEDE